MSIFADMSSVPAVTLVFARNARACAFFTGATGRATSSISPSGSTANTPGSLFAELGARIFAAETTDTRSRPSAGVTPPKTPSVILGGHGGVVRPTAVDPVCHGKERFDLRRATRSCEDLPGAYVKPGVMFVPGAGGRYRVARLLAATSAPAALQAKVCSYT